MVDKFLCLFRLFHRDPLQQRKNIIQYLPDALSEFGGSFVGETQHHDLLDTQSPFHDQPGDQILNIMGLSGSGGGLDQIHTCQRHGYGFEHTAHKIPPALSKP